MHLQPMRKVNIHIVLVVIACCFVSMIGCSSSRSTTTTTEVKSTPVQTSPNYQEDVTITETTTETTTETRPRKHGLVGGVFHLIGEIVAFPFRLIGGFFDAIF